MCCSHVDHHAYISSLSAVYPRGGSDAMAKALVPVIEAAGGRVLVRADVSEITVDDVTNRVTGVCAHPLLLLLQ